MTNIYISIIYSFIKQDYIQGSSSSGKKLVASCFHITVHSDESLAVGRASLKLRQAEALCTICSATGAGVLLRHPLKWLTSRTKGSVSFGGHKASNIVPVLFYFSFFLMGNCVVSYCQTAQGAQECLLSFLSVWVPPRTG